MSLKSLRSTLVIWLKSESPLTTLKLSAVTLDPQFEGQCSYMRSAPEPQIEALDMMLKYKHRAI